MPNEIPELSKGEFESYTKQGTVLIDFFAEWCMPCVMMSPVLEELSEKFKGKIKFGKINVDDNRNDLGDVSGKFGFWHNYSIARRLEMTSKSSAVIRLWRAWLYSKVN